MPHQRIQLRRRSRGAFTIVELLVVVSILLLLVSILLPSLRKAKYTANLAVCASNQRQVVMASLSYTADAFTMFPKTQTRLPGGTYTIPEWLNYHDQPGGLNDDGGAVTWAGDYLPRGGVLFHCPLAPGVNEELWTKAYDAGNTKYLRGSYGLYWGWFGAVDIDASDDHRFDPAVKVTTSAGSKMLTQDMLRYAGPRWGVSELWYNHDFTQAGLAHVAPDANAPSVFTNKIQSFWRFGTPTDPDIDDAPRPDWLNAGFVDGHVEQAPIDTLRKLRSDASPYDTVLWVADR